MEPYSMEDAEEEPRHCSRIKKWWKNFELRKYDLKYRIEPYFLIRKKKGVGSLITFWISALSVFLALYSCYEDVREMIEQDSPSVIEQEKYDAEESFIQFGPRNYDYFIAVQDDHYIPFVNESIYYPELVLQHNVNSSEDMKEYNLTMVVCSIKYKIEKMGDIDLTNRYCIADEQPINWTEIGLAKTFGKTGFKMIKLDFNYCNKEKNASCADFSVIQEKLNAARVTIDFYDNIFLPKRRAFNQTTKHDFFSTPLESKTAVTQYFKKTYISYKRPYQEMLPMFWKPEKLQAFQSSKKVEQPKPRTKESFFSYTLQLTESNSEITLKYLNPTSILGALFGTFGTITLIIRICLTSLFRFFDGNYYGQLMHILFDNYKYYENHYKRQIVLQGATKEGEEELKKPPPILDKRLENIEEKSEEEKSEAPSVGVIGDHLMNKYEDVDAFKGEDPKSLRRLKILTSKIRESAVANTRRYVLSNLICLKQLRKKKSKLIAYMVGKEFIDDYIEITNLIKRNMEFDLYYRQIPTDRKDPINNLLEKYEQKLVVAQKIIKSQKEKDKVNFYIREMGEMKTDLLMDSSQKEEKHEELEEDIIKEEKKTEEQEEKKTEEQEEKKDEEQEEINKSSTD